jgi:hypothetical protein
MLLLIRSATESRGVILPMARDIPPRVTPTDLMQLNQSIRDAGFHTLAARMRQVHFQELIERTFVNVSIRFRQGG